MEGVASDLRKCPAAGSATQRLGQHAETRGANRLRVCAVKKCVFGPRAGENGELLVL